MTTRTDSPVTVLGLGDMGSAIARVFAERGYPTTVWNRTAGKAARLVDAGARPRRHRPRQSTRPGCER